MTFLRQGQICVPIHLYGENVEKSFSQNILKANGGDLQCMIKVVIVFSYTQNFVTWGLSALAPGQYTCIKLCYFLMSSVKLLKQFRQISYGAFC